MSSPLDDLTRLPLRNAYLDAAMTALEGARTRGQAVSLLVMDVDQFKLINDTFGHLQGDDVLREVAEILRSSLRNDDMPARYAGDEFVALLPNTPPEAARDVAERICAALRAHPFPRRDGQGTVSVTASIGVASFPANGDSHDEVFAAADRALYAVKRRGRDGAALATASDAVPTHLPLSIERFVGRTRELGSLVALLEEATQGRPRIVSLMGEAGVGKTTLLRQLEPEVRLRGGSMLVGRCQEADVQPPYGPWAEVIAASRRLAGAPTRAWRELPRLVPDLAADATPDPRGGSKYLLLEEIAEYLRLTTRERPVVVVLDDMQWADKASWDALEYLVPQLENERVLFCLTVRAEEAVGETRERQRRLSRNEAFHELRLDRLTRDDMKQWIEAAFHRQDVGREFLAFLYRQTEGNPLFVVQLLRTLVDEGYVWHTGQKWDWKPVSELRLPVAVSDLMSRRLARLSEGSQALLVTAAVIGREFDLDLVLAAGAGSEDALLDAVDEAVRLSILEATAKRGGDRYAFTHALLSEVLRTSASPRRIKRVHEKVADALVRRSPDAVSEIVTHYDRAGVAPQAYAFSLRGAERASAVYAHEEATGFLRIAERHAGTSAELADVRVRLAAIAEATGRHQEAEELCDLAIEWYRAAGDGRRVLSLQLMRQRVKGLLGQSAPQTLEACRALEAESRTPGYERERVALLLVLSRESGRISEYVSAEAYARECVEVAAALADATLHADALNRHALTLQGTDPAAAGALFDRALAIYGSLGDFRGQANCHNNLGIMHTTAGAWSDAVVAFETAIALGRSAGTVDLSGVYAINLGVVHMKLGAHDRARERFGEAYALFSTTGGTERSVYALYNLAHLERERGELQAAAELYGIAATMGERLGHVIVAIGARAGSGLAHLLLGDALVARTARDDVAERLEGREDWFQGRELVEALTVRLLAHDGDVAGAAVHLERMTAAAFPVDAYGGAWLMTECAGVVVQHDPWRLRQSLDAYAPRVHALGIDAMRKRYDALLTVQ